MNTDKLSRALDAMSSMGRLLDEPSGKSTISSKHTPLFTKNTNGGQQSVYRFENGYGASVINSGISYGGLELAVLKFSGENWSLTYETPVTDDVEGDLTPERLDELLDAIKAL